LKFGGFTLHLSLLLLLPGLPAWASGITYTCNGNIETSTCSYLNTTMAGLYAGVFSNANASIYIQYGSTGLGSSAQYYNSTTFNSYLSALTSHEHGPRMSAPFPRCRVVNPAFSAEETST